MKLCKLVGGMKTYIPKANSISSDERNREICSKFDGGNAAQLATYYNLSETHIRRIIEKAKEGKRNGIH